MGELRDLAAALRAFDKRMTTAEECLLLLVRNSEQEAQWRHEQRGIEQRRQLEGEEQERAMLQVQRELGTVNRALLEISDRLDNYAATRQADVHRIHKLEQERPGEEITKP